MTGTSWLTSRLPSSPRRSALATGLFGLFTAAAAGGAAMAVLAVPSAPLAAAAPDPCAASTIARTVGTVANNTGVYLDSHRETNQALTVIAAQQGGAQSLVALKTYFDANPQAAKDLQAIQQPLTSLTGRCNLPLTVPQVLGMAQAVQGADLAGARPGGFPAALPGATSAAQSVAGTTGVTPPAPARTPAATGALPAERPSTSG